MSTLGILVLVIVSVLVGFFINSVIYHARSGVKVGKPAPGFILESLEGHQIGHTDWNRPPRPIILCFVSPKCNACRRIATFFQHLNDKYPEAEIDVILVGIHGDREEFKSWKNGLKLSLEVATDPDNTTKIKYAVYSLPTVCFISSGGLVRHYSHGFKPSDDTMLEQMYFKRLERMAARKKQQNMSNI